MASRIPWVPRPRRAAHRSLDLLSLAVIAAASLPMSGCRETGNGVTTPNQPPGTPVITSPTGGSVHAPGESVSFQGSANDPEDGSLGGEALVWTSSVDGEIGRGGSFTKDDLSEGLHTITLRATDSDGLTSVASISIQIQNAPPTATITAPSSGSSFGIGVAISFTGAGNDNEDGALGGGSLVWTSSVDGAIGTGTSFSRDDLSEGVHNITLTVTDSGGKTATASVTVRVENQTPAVTIANPASGSVYIVGNPIAFQGSAVDAEDGDLTEGSLSWTSSLDGVIGVGKTFNRADLSLGTHTITLTATDSDGLAGSASITVRVLSPPTARIDLPIPGSSFAAGTPVTFQGGADDAEDGALAGSRLVWRSSLDGEIGTGTTFGRPDLSVGVHTITLTATDSDGLKSVVAISITVVGSGSPPTATIATPADGGAFPAGMAISFQGSGADPEDGALTGGSLVWTSSRDGQIGTGGSFNRSNLSVGLHTITLTATDSDALTGTSQVTITVEGAPVVSIVSPVGGLAWDAGTSIGFEGSATDPEDGALGGASLVWTSSLDGQIGTGTSFNKSDLSLGSHTITLTATDSDGFTGSATVSVTVQAPGSAPVASITAPTTGSTYDQGATVNFQGSGTDTEDGVLPAGNLIWTSSRDGQIGTGTSFSRSDLSVGTHLITLTATDSDARTGTATVTITVKTGSAPTAGITSPGNGSVVSVGSSVSFQGSGNDAEDGALGGSSLVWTSSLDGQIGTGTSFSRSALSVGAHTITLTATDSDGRTATASVSLTVTQTTPILVKAGNSASSTIGVGGQVSIPIRVDLSQYSPGSNSNRLASIQVRVTWDTGVATYSSSSNGTFGAVNINTTDSGSGAVVASTFNGTGTSSTFTLFTLTLSGAGAGYTNVAIEVQSAGTEGGSDITGSVGTRSHGLTVGN